MKWCMCNPNTTGLPEGLILSIDTLNIHTQILWAFKWTMKVSSKGSTDSHSVSQRNNMCMYTLPSEPLQQLHSIALSFSLLSFCHHPQLSLSAQPPGMPSPMPCCLLVTLRHGRSPLCMLFSYWSKNPGARRTNSPSPHSWTVTSMTHVLNAS